MARTTPEKVREILRIKPTVDLNPYINDASDLVTEVCSIVKKEDGVTPYHTEARLTRIETWLAAHFVSVNYRRRIQEQAGSVGANYEGKVDLNLQVTEYGQQAIVLDTSGALAKFNNALNQVTTPLPVGVSRKAVHYLGKRE